MSSWPPEQPCCCATGWTNVRQAFVLQENRRAVWLSLSLLPSAPDALNNRQLVLLKQGYAVTNFNQSGHRIDVYISLSDSGQVLHIGPVVLLDPYPFKLLATIALFVLASISVAIYVLVRGLERRLSKLERAAIRLARGDLDTRVKTARQ